MQELRFFEIYRNGEYLQLLAEGIWTSFILTVGGAVAGMFFAIILSSVRYGRVPVLGWVSALYTEVIRNT